MRTAFSRRDFLKVSGLGAASLMVPGWLTRALAEPGAKTATRSLVLVMLGGGNDGLNTVVPLADPLYAKARPTLGIPKDQMLKLNDAVGLHPSMKKLRDLFDEGKVAVVNNVGYPNHDRSHFRSMEIWQTAQMSGVVRDGWLGRCLCDDNSTPHSVSFGSETPLALWADGGGVLAMENPGGFEIGTDNRHQGDRAHIQKAFRELYGIERKGSAEYVRKRGLEVMAQAERIRTIAQKPNRDIVYPNSGLAQGLRFIANAIEDDFGARVYMIGLGGFDTHANQRQQHANLLQTLSEAVTAFQKDLDARSISDRVTTATFSEFGRRVAENVSQGTDHGAAGPMFVVGKNVKGGIYGGAPDLEKLDSGDLAMTVDFRSVYAALLAKGIGVAAEKALGGEFLPLEIL
ncbi:MAG: hypothetical protein FD180_3941 [Planctomycetota bacterium]|nr:MAG: hypothetical protein FD180_3941 [Planctomycetota bacterium]